ncbi:PREDICTED: uncharacterized protein LOC104821815 [Tarenaya hassleriana]|uniref:uncharacterized protein LOC104821815 n=1 Tax=Tarenaya hassleriana TaxID=28532 RepID=UPI00053C469B|nr:PREDICTED: uncharacterized protein LOC104821815 [Tarenaya hassleriana]
MASWKKTITTPFRKAATLFNQPQPQPTSRPEEERRMVRELQGEVMACGYEDVLVMWSILDKSNPSSSCDLSSS